MFIPSIHGKMKWCAEKHVSDNRAIKMANLAFLVYWS